MIKPGIELGTHGYKAGDISTTGAPYTLAVKKKKNIVLFSPRSAAIFSPQNGTRNSLNFALL